MNNEYCLLLPTAAEPQNGFTPSSQIDFVMNHPTKELEPGTLRFTGRLNVPGLPVPEGGGLGAVAPAQVFLNQNAGAHSLLNHLIILFNDNQVELNTEYARFVAAETECKQSCIELGALNDQVVELKGVSQDGEQYAMNSTCLYGEDDGPNEGTIPFSIVLRCCLNKSNMGIPFDKTGPIRVRMILKEPNDVFNGDNTVPVSNITYTLSQVCLRYMIHDSSNSKEKVLMERVQYAGQQSLLSSFNTFSTVCPSNFYSCVLLFRDQTHYNTTNYKYDTIKNEGFMDASNNNLLPNYVEWTLTGSDTPLSFPLRTGEEMLNNYVLSLGTMSKNGINYAKLNNKNQSCGFGLGCNFGSNYPSQPVQTTINFLDVPTNKYNVYVFYKGLMTV